jgi:hypothetical protein
MKATPVLYAAAVLFGVAIGSANAGDDGGQFRQSPFASIQTQQPSVPVGDPPTTSLFTIGGVGVHVWAPVEPPYNAEANGNLAARNIWSPG